MIDATVLPDDDFNRSTQILLRHGFVVQGLPQAGKHDIVVSGARRVPRLPRSADIQKPSSLSPVGPTNRNIGEVIRGDPTNNGMTRVHSDGAIPTRRVSWDLSMMPGGTGFPVLPFTKQLRERESSSSQRASQTTTKFQRRSTIAAINEAERDALLQEHQGQQELPKRQHSSRKDPKTSKHGDVATAVRHHPRKSSSLERNGNETSLQRRRSSATTFGMSVNFDELLQQQQQIEMQELVQNPSETIVTMPKSHRYNGYRDDYFLGDLVRSSTHMIIESKPKRAIRAVTSIQIHDFAWIKRSDGLYTYAILAYRSTSPIVDSSLHPATSAAVLSGAEDEYMYFVVDDIGSTKMVPKSRWHINVRLVRENQSGEQ